MKRRARKRLGRRTEAGLSLVELMITMIVASLVTASTFIFFTGQQRIYETQTGLLNVQQNVWAALETLTRHIRASGTGMLGCVRLDSDGVGPDTGDPPPVGAAAPATGLRAFRSGVGVVRIPPLWIQNGAAGGTDRLTVAFGDGSVGNFSDATLLLDVPQDQPAVAYRTLPGQTGAFRGDEFAILMHNTGQPNGDRGCTLFQITGIDPVGDALLHTPGSIWNPAGNVAGLVPFDYPGGTATSDGVIRNFGRLTWVQFAIDAAGGPAAPPRLTMNRLDRADGPQILAEGIEDLQIAYACDTLPAGAPDGVFTEGTDAASRLVDEWIFNTPGDVPPAGCQRPGAVRLTVVARSLHPDQTLVDLPGNARPAAEDSVAGAADLFRHRVMSSTIYMRN